MNLPHMKSISSIFMMLTATLVIPACKHAESSQSASVESQGRELPPEPVTAPAAATATTAPVASPLPKGVDAKDLDAAEKKTLAEILAEQFDPCGKPRSFATALEAGDCPVAFKLTQTLITYLQAGAGKKAAIAQLLKEVERINTLVQIDNGHAPRRGPADAKVVVTEFSDFECPFCRRAVTPLDKLQKHYGFALYYRFFPLKLAHPNAEGAARAAWAAQQQGKFWEMHDLMFANADGLDWESVKKLAAKAGLDMKKFLADFESPASKAAVDADVKAGDEAGLDGTPTFYVNGRKAETLGQVQELVRELMQGGGAALPEPLAGEDYGPADAGKTAAAKTAEEKPAEKPAEPAPGAAPAAAPVK